MLAAEKSALFLLPLNLLSAIYQLKRLIKGQTIIFLSGLPFLGLADNFFKSNAFQTIFFITFCNENNFVTTIFKKCYRLFIDLISKKHFLCMHTHEKSHLNEMNSS